VPFVVSTILLPNHRITPLAVTACARPLDSENRPHYIVAKPNLVLSYGHGGVGLTQAPAVAYFVRRHLMGRPTEADASVAEVIARVGPHLEVQRRD
jgi:glycine/D-amino acid oxidase-like deaminating enzyme